jgi:xanthosine utilization system XapX-like protein
MVISHAEAAETLRDIEQTDRRTRVSGAYHVASSHFILWGLVWVGGYTGSGLVPMEKWGLVWLPLIVLGVIAALAIGRRGGSGKVKFDARKSFVMALAIGLFIGSVFTVFNPTTPAPYLVFPALIASLVYVLFGMFNLPRYTVIGASMFVATMAGFYLAGPLLPFWLAATGGGGLILSGLWLRRV